MHTQTFTIGRLATLANVNVETVRYYQRRGLMPEPRRLHGEARRYTVEVLDRLRWIRRAQRIGFSLQEIEDLLNLRSRPVCSSARAVVVQRLELIESRIRELATHRDELQAWVASCDANPRDECCPRLAGL